VAELERPQIMLLGDVADHLDVHVDPAVAAGVARRAYQHGYAQPAGRQQHLLQVVVLPLPRRRRGVGPQRHGPDVIGTGVGKDEIWPGGDADVEALDLERSEAEVAVGTEEP